MDVRHDCGGAVVADGTMIYLSSSTNLPEQYKWNEFGVMFSAKYTIGGLTQALDDSAPWMMDNNQFAGGFDAATWCGAMLKYAPYKATCLGIPVPDVVGDALATLRMFSQYWRIVHDLGYPVAFVSQDGITPELTPWDYFDVLFVGGTDEHKLGNEAGAMIAEAKQRGKWVHVGRVNSASRIKQFWMCDSVDGTGLSIDAGTQRVIRVKEYVNAIHYCRNRKAGKLGVNGQYQLTEVA